MGYGSMDYNNGHSSGKREGRAEERSRIRKIERESLGSVLAANAHFQAGVKAAQARIGRECGAIGSYVNRSTITVETGGLLGMGLFASHADPAQASQVLSDAEKIIRESLLIENLSLSEDDYKSSAAGFLNVDYEETDDEEDHAAPNGYELGHAAEFAASLTDKALFEAGYTGRVAYVSETLGHVHDENDWTEWLIGEEDKNQATSVVQQDKNYRKYLIDAVQDLAAPVQEKVNAVLQVGPPPYSPQVTDAPDFKPR